MTTKDSVPVQYKCNLFQMFLLTACSINDGELVNMGLCLDSELKTQYDRFLKRQ